jgi:hypothetical protein
LSELNIALAAVGGSVLVLGLLSGLIRRSILSEPLVALLVGVLVGPAALGLHSQLRCVAHSTYTTHDQRMSSVRSCSSHMLSSFMNVPNTQPNLVFLSAR